MISSWTRWHRTVTARWWQETDILSAKIVVILKLKLALRDSRASISYALQEVAERGFEDMYFTTLLSFTALIQNFHWSFPEVPENKYFLFCTLKKNSQKFTITQRLLSSSLVLTTSQNCQTTSFKFLSSARTNDLSTLILQDGILNQIQPEKLKVLCFLEGFGPTWSELTSYRRLPEASFNV